MQLVHIELIKNYVSAFSTNFLFNVGDYNGRYQVPGFGLFFKWQMALVVIGAFVLTMKKDKKMYPNAMTGTIMLLTLAIR